MELVRMLAERAFALVEAHADELTELDRAIGDGDHGHNMTRGFGAVAAQAEALSALPFGEAVRKAGMALVMKIGGASGPLYGSLLMDMGKAATQPPASAKAAAELLAVGINAVKVRGKSDAGAKTMLDVLIPVQAALEAGGGIAEARAAADTGLESTRMMRATKGRAAFLGDRSVGHLDPGARSAALLVHCVCDVVDGLEHGER